MDGEETIAVCPSSDTVFLLCVPLAKRSSGPGDLSGNTLP